MGARKIIVSLLTAAFLAVSPSAEAQMGAPQPIETPVAEKWRAPFAGFLRDFGIAEVEATVAASHAVPYPRIPGNREPEYIIFRVIHSWACDAIRDECMTIIGHIDQDKLIADLMFSAGAKITMSDVIRPVLGRNADPSLYFLSERATVTIIGTVNGFLILHGPASPDWNRK